MSSRALTDGARSFGPAEVAGRIAGVHWRWGAAGGQLAGWALVAAVNAVVIAVTPLPRAGAGPRVLHHAYDAGQLLALGVLSAAAVMLWQRVRAWSRALDAAANFACAAGLGGWMLVDDFDGFAGDLVGDGRAWLVIALGVTAFALGVPLAALAGRRLARGRLRLIAVGAAVVLTAANHLVASHDYPGVHFFVAWWAAVLAGAASCTTPAPSARRSARWLLGPATLSLWSLVFPPSNRVRLGLSRFSGAVVAPWRARLETHISPSPAASGKEDASAWFRSRNGLPDIPPSHTRPIEAPPSGWWREREPCSTQSSGVCRTYVAKTVDYGAVGCGGRGGAGTCARGWPLVLRADPARPAPGRGEVLPGQAETTFHGALRLDLQDSR